MKEDILRMLTTSTCPDDLIVAIRIAYENNLIDEIFKERSIDVKFEEKLDIFLIDKNSNIFPNIYFSFGNMKIYRYIRGKFGLEEHLAHSIAMNRNPIILEYE